jgi:ATP-dependent DNA ligase
MSDYLGRMFKAFEFCIPTSGTKVPAGPEWLHEIKYDGFRLRIERNGDRVRLITRGGYDWTKRYPWIVEAAPKNRQKHFVIDGEAVILGVDGVSDFNALHSGKHNEEVQLCAFDLLALDGDAQGLRVWVRGSGVEASRSTLSWRSAEALDQGQEPEASRVRASQRVA